LLKSGGKDGKPLTANRRPCPSLHRALERAVRLEIIARNAAHVISPPIAAGMDIVTVSKRLGHGSPSITLRVYAHAFPSDKDTAAARAIGALFGAKPSA
jgi:integrase